MTTTALDPTTLRARIRHLELQRTMAEDLPFDHPQRDARRRREVDTELIACRKQLDEVLGVTRIRLA
jgi:hypothetical protein